MPNELPPRDEYLPRIVDDQVRRYLEIFGAVEVAGTENLDGLSPRRKRQLRRRRPGPSPIRPSGDACGRAAPRH